MTKIEKTVPGNFPKVSKTYWACDATPSLNSSLWTWAADRAFRESFQGPGVSGRNGPPGPNFRSHTASTAAGAGRFAGDGARVTFRGALHYQIASQKLARLYSIAVPYE
jgi:hypothetical protein